MQAKQKEGAPATQALPTMEADSPVDAEALTRAALEMMGHADEAVRRAGSAVLDALRAHTYVREQLLRTAANVARRVEELQRSVQKYGRPSNELGALQGSGPELDRLCGEYARTREALTRLVRMANALFEATVQAATD